MELSLKPDLLFRSDSLRVELHQAIVMMTYRLSKITINAFYHSIVLENCIFLGYSYVLCQNCEGLPLPNCVAILFHTPKFTICIFVRISICDVIKQNLWEVRKYLF